MLSPSGGTTYLFTAQGVYTAHTGSLTSWDLLVAPDCKREKRVWSLVDGDAVLYGRAPAVRNRGILFTICASAPGVDERWVRKNFVHRTIMEPWERKELRECMALFPSVSEEQISTAVAQSGPTPRAVLQYLRDPIRYTAGHAAALADVISPSELNQLICDTLRRRPETAIADSHRLFVVRRLGGESAGRFLCEHVRIVDVQDETVLTALRRRFADLHYQAALTLLDECGSAPEASRLAAWLYDVVARTVISGTAALDRREREKFDAMQRQLTVRHDAGAGAP